MKKFALILIAALACGVGIGAGAVVAQSYTPNIVPNVSGSADLVAVIPNGTANVQSSFAYAGQIGAVEKFAYGGTISADPDYTFPNGNVLYSAHASGTLSAATLTTEPNPTDGKRECYFLDQTTTTLTWTANTGQTMGGNVATAGVAHAAQCIIYKASVATWYGSN